MLLNDVDLVGSQLADGEGGQRLKIRMDGFHETPPPQRLLQSSSQALPALDKMKM